MWRLTCVFVELKPFVAQASEWGIVGDLNNWGNDVVMYTTWHTKNLFVAYNVQISSGEFSKEAAVRTWTGSASKVKFTTTGTDKDHRAYVSKIKVTYE